MLLEILALLGKVGIHFQKITVFSLSTIEQKPITVIVKRQKNPIVGGFGPARTTLFGYFIRLDYAWGVEDGKIGKPIFIFHSVLIFNLL